MAIIELIEQGLTEEQALEVAEKQFGMEPVYARFVLAIEREEIESDVIERIETK